MTRKRAEPHESRSDRAQFGMLLPNVTRAPRLGSVCVFFSPFFTTPFREFIIQTTVAGKQATDGTERRDGAVVAPCTLTGQELSCSAEVDIETKRRGAIARTAK